jgi:hypothetical protein
MPSQRGKAFLETVEAIATIHETGRLVGGNFTSIGSGRRRLRRRDVPTPEFVGFTLRGVRPHAARWPAGWAGVQHGPAAFTPWSDGRPAETPG